MQTSTRNRFYTAKLKSQAAGASGSRSYVSVLAVSQLMRFRILKTVSRVQYSFGFFARVSGYFGLRPVVPLYQEPEHHNSEDEGCLVPEIRHVESVPFGG